MHDCTLSYFQSQTVSNRGKKQVQKIRKTWDLVTAPQPFLVTQTNFSFLGLFQGMIAIPSSGQTSLENWQAEPKGIMTTKVSSLTV